MLRDLEVPFVPSATDCLSWSEDGELAIAAAEYVHILVCLDLLRLFEMPLTRSPRYQSTSLRAAQIKEMSFQPSRASGLGPTLLRVRNGHINSLAAASSSLSEKNSRRATSWQHHGHLQE